MVGPGDVYGGDYVLYKGKDPSQSHSIATILVHDSHIVSGTRGAMLDMTCSLFLWDVF